MKTAEGRPIEILLVEDSPSDTELTVEALKDVKVRNHVSIVEDGVQAMEFLRRQGSMPGAAARFDHAGPESAAQRRPGSAGGNQGGRKPQTIPMVVLTTSRAEQDMLRAYQLHANCYITKPVDFQPVPGGGAVHRIVLAVRRDAAAALRRIPSGGAVDKG